MNKIGLRKQVYTILKKKTPKITKTTSDELVDIMLDTMLDALISTQRLSIRHFGIFEIKHCKERLGWNPVKSEHMTIKRRTRIKFKPSVELLARINPENQK